jgi:phosphoglycolate phosphatase
MPLHRAFYALTKHESAAAANEFCRIFIDHAQQVMADLTHVYPTTRPTARELKKRGMLLGIVSNKYRCGIETVLSRHGLDDMFDVVVGGDDIGEPKPSAEGLLKAMCRLGVGADEVLYVGDSAIDAETARRASTRFAAVLTGTTGRDEFELYCPEAILEGLTDLVVKIDAWRRA